MLVALIRSSTGRTCVCNKIGRNASFNCGRIGSPNLVDISRRCLTMYLMTLSLVWVLKILLTGGNAVVLVDQSAQLYGRQGSCNWLIKIEAQNIDTRSLPRHFPACVF